MTEPLLALIRKHESDGAVKAQGVASSYDVVSAFIPKKHRPKNPLTTYPVGEVLEWQAFVVKQGSASSAAGAYQIIRSTLAGLFKGRENAVFNPTIQDEAADALLIGRGWFKTLAGGTKPIEFADEIAEEWASLPVQWDQKGAHRWVKRGQSYYAGDGLNVAHCPPQDVLDAVVASMPPAEMSLEERVAALEIAVRSIQEAMEGKV